MITLMKENCSGPKQVATSIYKDFQFTTVSPSSNQEGMCPVLYLQIFVGGEGIIMYKMYEKRKRKKCTGNFVIPEKSAHS